MNIFYVDQDPFKAAQALGDKHVVKMVLESAQLLSGAARVYGITDKRLYKPTHVNHPCSIWVRENIGNYHWLYQHFTGLLCEYEHRYGKRHKCYDLKSTLWENLPTYYSKGITPIKLCMPNEYKTDDPVQSYRNYYNSAKKHLHKWTKRNPPDWIIS